MVSLHKKVVSVFITIPPSAKVFLLEDSDDRIAWFKQRLPGLVVAKNVQDAIKYLAEQTFDFVFLDHDLGLLDVDSGRTLGSGYDVAQYLSGTGFVGRNVFIHSWNTVGAAQMKDILEGAYAVPFGQFEIKTS